MFVVDLFVHSLFNKCTNFVQKTCGIEATRGHPCSADGGVLATRTTTIAHFGHSTFMPPFLSRPMCTGIFVSSLVHFIPERSYSGSITAERIVETQPFSQFSPHHSHTWNKCPKWQPLLRNTIYWTAWDLRWTKRLPPTRGPNYGSRSAENQTKWQLQERKEKQLDATRSTKGKVVNKEHAVSAQRSRAPFTWGSGSGGPR